MSEKILRFNKKNFFWDEDFENELKEKLNQSDSENISEFLDKSDFISKLKRILSDFPYLYIPDFFNEFISGNNLNEIYEKHSIHDSWTRQEILNEIFPFKERHFRNKKFENARELNLRNYLWGEKYERIINNCNYFSNELEKKLYENILRVRIIYYISILNGEFSLMKLKLLIVSSKDDFEDFDVISNELKQKFLEFSNEEFEKIFEKIINQLLDSGILQKNPTDPDFVIARMSLDKIKEQILIELRHSNGGIPVGELETRISDYFPSLKLLPNHKISIGTNENILSVTKIFAAALSELFFTANNQPLIEIKSKKRRLNSSMIYLVDDYQRILQRNMLKTKNLTKISSKFHGRKISPDNFIMELLDLDKGDFGDKDDQVTRIAGLVLAESVSLRPPSENLPEFDFSTDITSYVFREEQKDAMRKLDFQLNAKIFHCKVMLNDILKMEKVTELINALPENEKGIVITFEVLPKDVSEFLKNDKSIQVIDEDGLKIWASITSVIPSRKHSICKIHSDPVSGIDRKICQIDYIDFEEGTASVKILPEINQESVLIGSLEEIELSSNSALEYANDSKNYYEFLKIISQMSDEQDFVRALFDEEIIDHNSKNTEKINFEFEHSKSSIDLYGYSKNNIIRCDCLQWIEKPLFLCKHLIKSLDFAYREFTKNHENGNEENNPVREVLEKITRKNISIILDRLGVDDKNYKNSENQLLVKFVNEILKIKEN